MVDSIEWIIEIVDLEKLLRGSFFFSLSLSMCVSSLK